MSMDNNYIVLQLKAWLFNHQEITDFVKMIVLKVDWVSCTKEQNEWDANRVEIGN